MAFYRVMLETKSKLFSTCFNTQNQSEQSTLFVTTNHNLKFNPSNNIEEKYKLRYFCTLTIETIGAAVAIY